MDIKDFKDVNLNDFVENIDNVKLDRKEQDAMETLKEQYGTQVEELINKFQNLSEPELITELFKLINQKKQNGTFNPQEIDNIAKIISPLLTDEQRDKMNNLLYLIKQ